MLIKNLTSERQKLVIKELTGEHRAYAISVEPNGITEVDKFSIPHIEKYAGVFEFGGCQCAKCEEPEPVAPVIEEVKVEVEEPEVEVVADAKVSDAFVCEICGAEFASARGLASHKSKSHPE